MCRKLCAHLVNPFSSWPWQLRGAHGCKFGVRRGRGCNKGSYDSLKYCCIVNGCRYPADLSIAIARRRDLGSCQKGRIPGGQLLIVLATWTPWRWKKRRYLRKRARNLGRERKNKESQSSRAAPRGPSPWVGSCTCLYLLSIL